MSSGGVGDVTTSLKAYQDSRFSIILYTHKKGLPLVVKGPLFPYLEAKRPNALARILADVVARAPAADDGFSSFETLQVNIYVMIRSAYGADITISAYESIYVCLCVSSRSFVF